MSGTASEDALFWGHIFPSGGPCHSLPLLATSGCCSQVSAEVLEVGRRIGLDLYEYVSSFATNVSIPGSNILQIQMPSNVLERCAHAPVECSRVESIEREWSRDWCAHS